ncbi:MAG: UDP-N-acetylglucosamine diphosphorylase/glucosamine-1-phosphate N-acetyltransferase [Betaproteobacteria bacterium]|nr:MAG: UDP-N-acetylglucosamine diphosphorylase/glucosamine-1-phosphate N-acetyltransferase [Betaproteobacteria bacterium]
MNVVVLAAGMGKRMHSRIPKVLHLLAGKPMLAHVVDTARALRPIRICVVYGHGGEAVPAAFGAADLQFARQDPQLGTGHAVQQALPYLQADARTLILYGDVPLVRSETLSRLTAASGDGLGVLTVSLDDPTGYGRILRDVDGRITGIVEEKDASPAQKAVREVNTGIMLVPAGKLGAWLGALKNDNAQAEYYLTDIVRFAIEDGVAVHGVEAAEEWETLGVNSKSQLARLERIYQRRQAESLLARGVTLVDPDRIDIRGTLEAGTDVRIDVNCVFEGAVRLGNDVTIGANCILNNVTVGDGSEILPFCHLAEADIGAANRIGPFSRVRPGALLGEDVHIGNFVEVKASELGKGSKVNHLAYVGDSTVGANVNIGAGTITCNYDGAYKHRTVIEDDVHIGSDVQLVAPVTVGRGATVGAGTTVWRNVPPGGLVLNKKEQLHRSDWTRPTKSRS